MTDAVSRNNVCCASVGHSVAMIDAVGDGSISPMGGISSTCPTSIADGSEIEFAAANASLLVSKAAAICASVSPCSTTYVRRAGVGAGVGAGVNAGVATFVETDAGAAAVGSVAAESALSSGTLRGSAGESSPMIRSDAIAMIGAFHRHRRPQNHSQPLYRRYRRRPVGASEAGSGPSTESVVIAAKWRPHSAQNVASDSCGVPHCGQKRNSVVSDDHR